MAGRWQHTFPSDIPGLDQGSDRAEVFALVTVVSILAAGCDQTVSAPDGPCVVRVVGDCQWVMDQVKLCNHSRAQVNANVAHHDLWQQFADSCSQLALHKIGLGFEFLRKRILMLRALVISIT